MAPFTFERPVDLLTSTRPNFVDVLADIVRGVTGENGGPFSGTETVGKPYYTERQGKSVLVRPQEKEGILWTRESRRILTQMMAIAQDVLRGAFPPRAVDKYGQTLDQPVKGPYPRSHRYMPYRGWFASYKEVGPYGAQIESEGGRRLGLVARATVESPHAEVLLNGRKGFVAVNSSRVPEDGERKYWMVFRGKRDGKVVFIRVDPKVKRMSDEAGQRRRKRSAIPKGKARNYIQQGPIGPNPKLVHAFQNLTTRLQKFHYAARTDLRVRAEQAVVDYLDG